MTKKPIWLILCPPIMLLALAVYLFVRHPNSKPVTKERAPALNDQTQSTLDSDRSHLDENPRTPASYRVTVQDTLCRPIPGAILFIGAREVPIVADQGGALEVAAPVTDPRFRVWTPDREYAQDGDSIPISRDGVAILKLWVAPLRGIVYDETGRPLPNVKITIYPKLALGQSQAWKAFRSAWPLEVMEQKDGSFGFPFVPCGLAREGIDGIRYLVRAEDDTGRRSVSETLVRPGQVNDVAVMLLQADIFLVKGRVLDWAGRPLKDATVVIESRRKLGESEAVLTSRAATTDESGSFVVQKIMQGGAREENYLHTLRVTAKGHAAAERSLGSLHKAQDDYFEVQMFKGSTLSGTIVDENGKPIAGVTVHVTATADTAGRVISVTTDKDGRFVCDSLEPEEYSLTASAPQTDTEMWEESFISIDSAFPDRNDLKFVFKRLKP